MQAESSSGSGSILDVARAMLSRRKWLAIFAFGVPFSIVLSFLMFLPSLYRASATVIVEGQQVPESFVRSTVTSGLEMRLQTISQEILSRARLESIINRFRLYEELKKHVSNEEVIERMRGDIGIDLRGADKGGGQRGTIAFALSFRGRDPQTVAQVANTLASFYIEENLKVRGRQAAGTSEFLKVQLQEVKKRLDEQEKDVSEWKKRYAGQLPQQMDSNLSLIDRLNSQLRLNLDNQARLLERRQLLSRQLGDVNGTGPAGTPAAPDSLAELLARRHEELRQLRTVYSEKYPDVIRMKEEIASLERELADSSRVSKTKDTKEKLPLPTNPYALRIRQSQEEIDAEMRLLKNEEARLTSAVRTYVARVENAPRVEQEYRDVARDYETTRELYANLTRRHEEAQISESMEQRQKGESFRVVDPALPPEAPVAPNRLKVALLGFVGSLGLAVALVFLVERINPAFHSVEALRAFTSLPILLTVPKIITRNDIARHRRRTRLIAASAMVGLVVIVAASYVAAHGNEYLVSMMARTRL